MKLIDANLLLLSYDVNAALHLRARKWLEATLSSGDSIGIPMLSVAAFVRIGTDKRLPRLALRMADALAAVDSWLELDNVSLVHTSDTNWRRTQECIRAGNVTGAMVTDAQIAALAMQHGAILYSNDRDFSRFPQLRWVDSFSGRA